MKPIKDIVTRELIAKVVMEIICIYDYLSFVNRNWLLLLQQRKYK